LKEPRGALVADIYRGGPAWNGGIRRGDVVVGFAGKQIKGGRELSRLAADAKLGSEVEVEVVRGGERKKLKVKIEEPPPEMRGGPEQAS